MTTPPDPAAMRRYLRLPLMLAVFWLALAFLFILLAFLERSGPFALAAIPALGGSAFYMAILRRRVNQVADALGVER
jgi:hypothetical protein